MPEIHLRQPGFTYNDCGSFTKNIERVQIFKEATDSIYIYQNELNKICYQHDMGNAHFKNLARTTASDKVLRHKTFTIAKSPKYHGYQRYLASMV